MHSINKTKNSLPVRTGLAIISLILCITMAGSLVIMPVLASDGLSGGGEARAREYMSTATTSSLRAAANSGIEIDKSGSTEYVFVNDLTDTSVGHFKECFRNRDSQIKVFRNNAELSDTDLIGTGCTVKCVSTADPTVIYETATAVVMCDVNGDGAVNETDWNLIVDEAVMGIDSIEDGSVFEKAADAKKESSVVLDAFDLSLADLVISGEDPYVGYEKSSVNYNEFTTVFEHTDSFIYRLGNGNTVQLGKIFAVETAGDSAVVSNDVQIGAYSLDSVASVTGSGTNLVPDSTAKCTYTRNASDWTKSTLKFTGEGLVELTIYEGDGKEYSLLVEIVNANNATSATSASSANIVLLNDVSAGGLTVSNGYTLYGNGFTVADSRTDTGNTSGYVTITGGRVNNVSFIGYEPATAVTSGVTNQGYAPAVRISGDTEIYNCYISGGRYAVYISGTPRVYFKNTTFDGGAVGNMYLAGGDIILEDCNTSISTRGGVKGLGIQVASITGVSVTLNGQFKQYNWMKESDLPSTYKSALSSLYSNTTYAYTYNGTSYLNTGIMFMNESDSFTKAIAQSIITDNTSNTYAYEEKTMLGHTATIYTSKASGGSPEMLSMPAYIPSSQIFTVPSYSFDYTTKNYIPKQVGSNEFCYYDSTTHAVNVSFDKLDSSSNFEWDTDILTVSKYGQNLSSTVAMNNVDYTNGNISFTDSGNYEAVYTYVDPFNYDIDGVAYNHTYTQKVKFNVTAVEPGATVYYASFSYDGAAGNYAAKKVIGSDSNTYVMPDVTSTIENKIGSTTVAGQTIYYPIVTVGPTSSNGNTSYSSGKGYYFAPVFSELHIIDYNQDTGAKQYEYSKSTNTWPRGNSASTGPNTDYFTCASGEKVWSNNSPYARSTNSQYYKYGSNNLGVCYTTNDIEKDNSACNHLVQYHYVSTDGTTYYYYIYYKFTAMTYSSCVAEGTLVTMADGSKKPIEQINQGDMVMTWSLWNGCYEAQPVAIKWYHGTELWQVLTLRFSDGTEVRTINQHGFFNADKNTYSYITPSNVEDFLGDRFIKQQSDGSNAEVTLVSYALTEENVGCYSLQTAFNDNFMVEGMLSITGEDFVGRFEFFDVGENMKYDEAKMQADIDTYGLYSYEEFSDYLTEQQFYMFNGQYFKVLVGKGVFTRDDIIDIIRENLK